MAEIPYVCLYRSYEKELELLSPEQLGRLMWALLRFLNHGEEPDLPDPERYLWPRLREQHLRDAAHYDDVCQRNRTNGEKGGRPRVRRIHSKPTGFRSDDSETEKPTVFLDDSSSFPKPVGPKEREKEKEKEKEREKEREKEKECLLRSNEHTDFSFPTFIEVKDYCIQEGLTKVDPQKFWDYYEMVGWQSGNKPIRDWKAALRLWNTTEQNKPESKGGAGEDVSEDSVGTWGTVV